MELIWTWSKNCALADITANAAADPTIVAPTGLEFKITDSKLYVAVVTLSTKDDNNFLEQFKWNKYRSEMTNQTKTNHWNHLINPTLTKVNRLFVISFENEEDRTSLSKYNVPKVEIKDFNVLIDGKNVFDVPVKNKEEAYENITVNLLDCE